MNFDTQKYIEESNAIENVYSDNATQDSIQAWNYLKQQEELTHEKVKKTHELILQNLQPGIVGEYRDIQVYVGKHIPPSPEEVEQEITTLLLEEPSTHKEALEWHVDFEKIHPFTDGNGRVGRMLYWWHCLQIDVKPYLFKASERQEYYKLFREDTEASVFTQIQG